MTSRVRRVLDRYRLAVLLFFICYPLLSGTVLAVRWSKTANEIYPFFSWALFCFVPGQKSDLGIRIVEVDGDTLADPTFIEQAPDLFPGAASSTTHLTIQQIDRRAARDDDASRHLLEQNVLLDGHASVTYEVVLRKYDCLERYRTGRSEELTRLYRHRCTATR